MIGRESRSNAIELDQWRLIGPRVLDVVNAELARQGDNADRDLIQLQHALAELLQPRAPVQPQQSKT